MRKIMKPSKVLSGMRQNSKYSNETLRGIIAVAMGCDAYKSGVKGMSYAKINQAISDIMTKKIYLTKRKAAKRHCCHF